MYLIWKETMMFIAANDVCRRNYCQFVIRRMLRACTLEYQTTSVRVRTIGGYSTPSLENSTAQSSVYGYMACTTE